MARTGRSLGAAGRTFFGIFQIDPGSRRPGHLVRRLVAEEHPALPADQPEPARTTVAVRQLHSVERWDMAVFARESVYHGQSPQRLSHSPNRSPGLRLPNSMARNQNPQRPGLTCGRLRNIPHQPLSRRMTQA